MDRPKFEPKILSSAVVRINSLPSTLSMPRGTFVDLCVFLRALQDNFVDLIQNIGENGAVTTDMYGKLIAINTNLVAISESFMGIIEETAQKGQLQ